MATAPAVAVMAAAALLIATALSAAAAQNCSCPPDQCCSQFGYCGTGDAYCSPSTCQAGACFGPPATPTGSSVAAIVTESFFDGIIAKAGSSCEGKNFYTRNAFLAAAGSFPAFGATGGLDVVKREIAAFFAHTAYETGNYCYINEVGGASQSFCDAGSTQWPCAPGQSYYGRGPLQITWNFNYGPAGQSIGFDGLGSPGLVATDPVISFKTALWLWMSNVHGIIVSGQGFGATIRAVDSLECDGGNAAAMNSRVALYQSFCNQLGVDPGSSLSC